MKPVSTADMVIKSSAVFTSDGLAPFAGGVAIAGDRVLACGDERHLAPCSTATPSPARRPKCWA